MVSASMSVLLLQRRSLCTKIPKQWKAKQITISNFQESLDEINTHISNSDFIAVSMQRTGSFSAPWQRLLPFDTAETAYCKAKDSAHRFQLLQFAVCPFSIASSNKLIAHPYNFHLFPRDELRLGMPAYSFSCQTSYLTSLAREGFDFNACIYDGISYLSRAQESKAKIVGNPLSSLNVVKSSSTPTIADTVFVQRIKSRIKNWIKTCKNSSSSTSKDEALLTSLRKIVLGNEEFGSRPALTIDVCSKRQVELILEILVDFQKIVPVVIPGKGNTALAIRLVLMKSKEDKDMFERERQILEEKENKKLLGFREVIELISASQKPVLSHNYLNDSTFIHSKFIAPLPPEVDEFIDSLCTVFPHVIDVNRMMKEIGTSRKVTSIPAAFSYLKNHFFAPVDMEIPDQTTVNEGKTDGLDALWICYLFMKICTILKINPNVIESGNKHLAPELQKFTNLFHPHSSDTEKPVDDISVWTNNSRRVGCEHLVFLWGFRPGMTASTLKSLLHKSHYVFFGEFDVKLVGKSCAIVVFWEPGLSKAFLDAMNSVEISGSLRELVSDGLRVACYDTYRRVCRLGLWEVDLPESLERALERPDCNLETSSDTKFWDINWCKDNVINLDDL